jgi:uncharacterized protein (TIGR02284 family)
MSNENINVLNSVTKTLIDSCKGYQICSEIADDSFALQAEFKRRANERQELVSQFQNLVATYGGEPKTSGRVSGAVHRGFTRFSSVFGNDEAAALEALDDGEEYLSEKIEDKLEYEGLTHQTRDLLTQAHAQAKAGERFADIMEKMS